MDFMTVFIYVCAGVLIGIPVIAAIFAVASKMIKRFSEGRLKVIGVSAPAVVNSVKVGTAMSSGSGAETRRERLKWRVYFNVQVQPENEPSFQAEFMSFLSDYEREGIKKEKKIWVRYDPNDHSKVTFEEADSTRVQRAANDHYIQTIPAYWEMDAKYHAPLRLNGMRSEAVILRREKIVDGSSTPGGPTLYSFFLDVFPNSLPAFKAKTQMMIQNEEKFAIGDRVYVRFDPKNTSIVAMEHIL
jgi:hypothetical protein